MGRGRTTTGMVIATLIYLNRIGASGMHFILFELFLYIDFLYFICSFYIIYMPLFVLQFELKQMISCNSTFDVEFIIACLMI
jgi:hypothetical protein